jgi:hypothetical protein
LSLPARRAARRRRCRRCLLSQRHPHPTLSLHTVGATGAEA